MPMHIRPIYEVVEEALSGKPATLLHLQEAKDSGELPPCYYAHPVVVAAGPDSPVVPFSFLWMGFHTALSIL